MSGPTDGERRPAGEPAGGVVPGENNSTVSRRHGRVKRLTRARSGSARCLQCDATWTGTAALGAASSHAQSGHVVQASYSASYLYFAPPEALQEAAEGRRERARAALLDHLAANPEGLSLNRLRKLIHVRPEIAREVLDALAGEGRVARTEGPRRSLFYRLADTSGGDNR